MRGVLEAFQKLIEEDCIFVLYLLCLIGFALVVNFEFVYFAINDEYLPELLIEDQDTINRICKFISEAKLLLKGKDEGYIMELLGSLLFLINYGYPKPSDTADALTRFLVLKPRFNDDAEVALRLLEKYSLV